MNISEQLKKYIVENQPVRRKDLVKHLIVNVKKQCKEEDYNPKDYEGYYSVNFQNWERNGHITRNKDGYRVTKDSLESGIGMYTELTEHKVKRLEKALQAYKEHYYRVSKENRMYRSTLRDLNERINNIHKSMYC